MRSIKKLEVMLCLCIFFLISRALPDCLRKMTEISAGTSEPQVYDYVKGIEDLSYYPVKTPVMTNVSILILALAFRRTQRFIATYHTFVLKCLPQKNYLRVV